MLNNMSAERSREDYLEAILTLISRKGACRATDIAEHMGYSKASVSVALKKLEENSLVVRDEWRILLTAEGEAIARETLEKHSFFTDLFTACGIDPRTSENEACLVEHVISDSSFRMLQERLRNVIEENSRLKKG